jgi:hypothetical protein
MGRTWNFVQRLRFVHTVSRWTLPKRSAAPGIVRSPMWDQMWALLRAFSSLTISATTSSRSKASARSATWRRKW